VFVFLAKGLIFGLSSGISPGPLTTLLVSETLMHRTRAGIKVALAPLITDGPIILCCFFLLMQFSNQPFIFGIVSLCGAFYILYLGIKSIRLEHFNIDADDARSPSLMKGILTNALNPHPYIFWISVGSTTMIRALDIHLGALVLFLAGFYFCLVGAKIILAALVGVSRRFLSKRIFVVMNNALGAILILFSGFLFYEGYHYLLR
jgi:threonine/homoserine/homoserine lactone efflux protein